MGEKVIYAETTTEAFELDLSSLANGSYYLIVDHEKYKYVHKIIKL